jgi:hypothetical protein
MWRKAGGMRPRPTIFCSSRSNISEKGLTVAIESVKTSTVTDLRSSQPTSRNHHPMTLTNSSIQTRLALCAAALTGTAAAIPSADAAIVTFNTPINVPQTLAGIYINFGTGATGASAGALPGWDFNPYQINAQTNLGFYWNPAPASSNGGVATAAGGSSYANLAIGTVVGPSSPFTAAIGGTAPNYRVTGTQILGFRFFNEATNAINYGYDVIQTTASGGFPATIRSWSYENNGGAITVVPEPSTTALLTVSALALGAAGVRRWRKAA